MHKVLLLIDFVGPYAVFPGQSEDAILSWTDVSPAQIDPLGLLILEFRRKGCTDQNTGRSLHQS